MRLFGFIITMALLITACDENRIFQKNIDFNDQEWLVSNRPTFEFTVAEITQKYNVYCNIRNEVSYPKANLYFTYYISDSTGKELQKRLVSEYLFDKKTGKPFGSSGLGDIYDHQILIEKNYTFKHPGKYNIMFEQFMRTDTLTGILAIGLRVEKIDPGFVR